MKNLFFYMLFCVTGFCMAPNQVPAQNLEYASYIQDTKNPTDQATQINHVDQSVVVCDVFIDDISTRDTTSKTSACLQSTALSISPPQAVVSPHATPTYISHTPRYILFSVYLLWSNPLQ